LRGEGVFVAEGRLLVERLLRSRFPTDSVLVIEPYAAEFAAMVPADIPLYVASEALLRDVVGFNFHQGALAAGRRRPFPSASELAESLQARQRQNLVVLPEVTKPENLGLIVRSAAALGVGGVLLGERCCDPLARRALRLSMGSVFQVPLARSIDLAADLLLLRQQFGFTLFATVLAPDAEPLPAVQWPRRAALLFGNEFDGLSESWLNLCDRRITIPMQAGVDSLNLGVAAGVFLYEMQRA
ncbi:MAG: RNA methyltransferase, partial [Patescibacteria group bacterium]|nr:RNA methyltransferase [Patescibacteria group bacterium]